ncbi:MAG: TIGR01777 family oxidoreductase [Gemmatimonadaceae bacterium]
MTTPVLEGREPWTRMVVAISGSSGLVGSALVKSLESRGNHVRRIVRGTPAGATDIAWDPARGTIDGESLEGLDAVINLAGENLAQRWTRDARRRIRDSRVGGTATLARALAGMRTKPRVFLSASAVGIYGSRGDEVLDERSPAGSDFLADICVAWEAATAPAADAGIRVVTLRSGVVLSRDGGALTKLLRPFKLGVGGRLGSGHQWMSWLSIADYPRIVNALLANADVTGPVNVVAPNPVTNAELSRTLALLLGRPAFFAVPKIALELLMGEMAEDTLLASQRAIPRRLLDAGFEFQYPTIESALRPLVTRTA